MVILGGSEKKLFRTAKNDYSPSFMKCFNHELVFFLRFLDTEKRVEKRGEAKFFYRVSRYLEIVGKTLNQCLKLLLKRTSILGENPAESGKNSPVIFLQFLNTGYVFLLFLVYELLMKFEQRF